MSTGPFRAVSHADPAGFLARAESWLLAAEAENNLILSVAKEWTGREPPPAGSQDAPWFTTVEGRSGDVVGCAFRTPPFKVCLTHMPADAAEVIAEAAAERFTRVPGFLGPEEVALAAARAWASIRGGSPRIGMRQRIHRLDEVSSPNGVAGRMRSATAAELPRALEWGEAFARDAGAHFRPPDGAVAGWIASGLLHMWEVAGEPVSMAIARGGTRHGVRVGYVYTPPEHRGSGYATALVAALSQHMLDSGFRFCVLYTDLANPTSNAIYARVGYRPLCDVTDVDLD